MAFELNDEKATDVLIWWIEGADGSIEYREEQTVRKVLDDLDYSLETFYEETLLHIGALSNEGLQKLVDRAIQWGVDNFDDHRKQKTIALLETIASCNDGVTEEQREKLDRIEDAFS